MCSFLEYNYNMKIQMNKHITAIRKHILNKYKDVLDKEHEFDCLRGYNWYFKIEKMSQKQIREMFLDICSTFDLQDPNHLACVSKLNCEDKKISVYLSQVVRTEDYSQLAGHVLEIIQLRPMKV